MIHVEKVESLKGFYFVGNHAVRIHHGNVTIGETSIKAGAVTIPVAELDAIHKLIHEGE